MNFQVFLLVCGVPNLNHPISQTSPSCFQNMQRNLFKTQRTSPLELSIIPSLLTSQPNTVPCLTSDKIYANGIFALTIQPTKTFLRTFQTTLLIVLQLKNSVLPKTSFTKTIHQGTKTFQRQKDKHPSQGFDCLEY